MHYRLCARFARAAVLEARGGHYRLGARFARATVLETWYALPPRRSLRSLLRAAGGHTYALYRDALLRF